MQCGLLQVGELVTSAVAIFFFTGGRFDLALRRCRDIQHSLLNGCALGDERIPTVDKFRKMCCANVTHRKIAADGPLSDHHLRCLVVHLKRAGGRSKRIHIQKGRATASKDC